jgi:hypothetical protein
VFTKCLVVVDSRNVRGQSRKVFGHSRETLASGIRKGLRLYGLDPVEIAVGVATRTSSSSPSVRLRESLEHNARFKKRLEAEGAMVLEGNLVQRGNAFEEKQVDVLCALAIADAADRIKNRETDAVCIVVLSEDMDLMPAIDFARTRDVPTYAAAYDTVHQRPEQRDWIILHEAALKNICDPPGRKHGSDLRAVLASIAMASSPESGMWKVVAPRMDDGRALLRNNLGASGLWQPPPRTSVQKRDAVDLFVCGVEMDPHTSRFPYLLLQQAKPAGPASDLEVADVLYWTEPTLIKVRVCGTGEEATLRATPGSLLPGQEVAVIKVRRDGNCARYLVGALSDRPIIEGWPSERTAFVTLTAPAKPTAAWVAGNLEATSQPVLVKASFLHHAEEGTRIVATLIGASSSGVPQAMPLTCCLP